MIKHCPFTRWGEYDHSVILEAWPPITLFEIERWLNDNNICEYTRKFIAPHSQDLIFWFKNGEDAVYFALKWAGK